MQAWSPWTLGDREVLEAVQRRAVKSVSNCKGRTYEERLEALHMDTLVERRTRGDLLQTYRVVTKKNNVDPTTWFTMYQPNQNTVTTRQDLNIMPKQWNTELRHNFWSWNDMPSSVKTADSLNTLKNSLDNLREKGRARVGQQ